MGLPKLTVREVRTAVAGRVVLEAAVRAETSLTESAEFWQLLLSAELSPAKSRAILESLGSSLSVELLRRHSILSTIERERIQADDLDLLTKGLALGIRPIERSSYSEMLQQWVPGPPVLFGWGPTEALHAPTVAIVGTRGASPYGKAAATKFAEALARSGVTIISGGALGVDAAAHRGALTVGGRTTAVLAGGVDRLYPSINRGLFEQIRQEGCLLSQFAIGSRPDAYKFLARNELIAALSQAVIVIEAPQRSGSLRTAGAANDLGRQVFVVPATIDMLSFSGSHALIRDGATLVDHPDQVLEALKIEKIAGPARVIDTSNTGDLILGVLSMTPTTIEKIAEAINVEPSEVMAELTLLEMEGQAVRADGGFVKGL